MANPINFVSGTRTDVAELLDAWEALQARMAEYVALGGGSFIDDYFTANPELDITQAQFIGAFSTMEAVSNLMAAGHATNLYTVKP